MKLKRDDDDAELFREAMRDVKPLAQKPLASRPLKPPRARFTRRNARPALEDVAPAVDDPPVAGDEALSFRRAGVQSSVLRKLRRGEYGVQAQIDLHGLTSAQARQALQDFLHEATARGARCIRVVHGKGLRSGSPWPVLKNTVSSILRRSPSVVAFVSAPQADGGTGATYVLLRA